MCGIKYVGPVVCDAARCNDCLSSKGHEQAQMIGRQNVTGGSLSSIRSLAMACNIEACCTDYAGQGRAGQGRAGQGWAGQGREYSTAKSSQTGYNIAAQGRAWAESCT